MQLVELNSVFLSHLSRFKCFFVYHFIITLVVFEIRVSLLTTKCDPGPQNQ